MAAFDTGQYPFDKPWAKPPQIPENMPRNLTLGSKEHPLFLFCLCYHMRGGIDSITAIKSLAKLYETKPEIFVPENGMNRDPQEITGFLREVGLGFQSREIGRAWVENFKMLVRYWDSSPVKLLEGVETYEEACERIRNKLVKKNRIENKNSGFLGFQEKMVSMLIHFLMEAGFIDSFHFPPPVDFHVLRTMFGHEILLIEEWDKDNYNKKTLSLIRELLSGYLLKYNVNPLRLCEAMWIISRTLCSQHPGNISNVGDYEARKTTIKPIDITWNRSQVNSYFRTCGSCPIERTCKFNIPSAYYYITGNIVIRGTRQKPPQEFLIFES
ncbi:MAG: hypothetical protein HYT61_02095 [Candidatus Yanofskybacteria bacterium]|nr:hypothetical protein [Candidatus Yanofskybacteria bacterium]